ncbi:MULTISPECIES: DUF932 domain-containing protein [Cyclobacteriaceae]|uniref:DUF932 domain-containing protein n=2 Tax=Cyclobacteriaceae TaxID=563798 RepID=A0ABV9T0Y1_9BACT
MSHNINFNSKTGKHSFFSVRERAWHGLGRIVKDCPTSADAIRFAGLDYEVEKRHLFTYDNENQIADEDITIKIPELEVPGYYATVRTDTEQVLGVVGRGYEVVQNWDIFSFFDAIVGGGEGIHYETAGALGKGERVFITAKLPGYIRVGNDDLIEKYLLLTASHDGFGSIKACFTPIRVVCNNTLNAALKNMQNCVKIRHTATAKERLEQAHKLMGISNQFANGMDAIFNHWAKVRITDYEVKKLIQMALVPSKEVLQKLEKGKWDELSTRFKNTCESAFEYAMADDTQQLDTTKGTLFGAFNAVSGYFQNVANFKDGEAKFVSIMEGTAKLRTQEAFRLCNGFAKSGSDVFHMN